MTSPPAQRLWTLSAVAAVAARPRLWFEALLAMFAVARRDWWRRWPPAPRPDDAYVAWRVQTAYGARCADVSDREIARDLVSFLEFRRDLRLTR